ncbi:MAG: AAA family ATPase [Verrucomicrobiales bacterium]|nr:AAA family ATPase [Verrucomicrobiales bacterium]
MPALYQISLSGFKSIRDLPDFKLGRLNVLVGPNGAGKSNLVDFFRMLRAMADGGFQRFITNQGGADGFFFEGPKETKEIGAHLVFGRNEFRFTLEATVASDMTIKEEATRFRGSKVGQYPDWRASNWHSHGVGKKESSLPTWKDGRSPDGKRTIDSYVYEAVASWTVYHFHDTSSSAPMRRPWPARDFRELLPDAGNIAPFLLRMRETNAASYQRIRETIQLIAPFFDDFLLEPETKGDAELVRLEWRQRGSRFAFQPYQFSDGTIRFICLATALLQPSPPSTVVIDEPELGLHPVALATLAALLHERAGRTQLLVSTQSPALLDHFEPEHVVVVERAEGASVFKRLESAELQHWITDYSLGELVRKDIIQAGPRHD